MNRSNAFLAAFLLIGMSAVRARAHQTLTQTVTALNKSCNAVCSVIDVPELNGNPSAVIVILDN